MSTQLNLKEVWGIDIGSSCIRAVKLVRIKDGIKLVDYDIRELSYRGNDEEKILEAIQKALTGLAGRKSLAGQSVFISVPGAMSFQRIVNLPPCPVKKIPSIMQFEAKQQIPFDLNEVIWDYQLLSPEDDVSKGRVVALFAAKKQVINPFLKCCAAAEMRVVGVQLTHIALLNFLVREQTDDEPFGILDFGGRYSELVAWKPGNICSFGVRPINLSGNGLTDIVAERKRLSFFEAEQEKLLTLSSGEDTLNELFRPAMSNLSAEMQRSLGYFKSQLNNLEISTLYLTGRGIGFGTGLTALRKSIGKPVKIIQAPNQLSFKLAGSPEVFFEDCRQLGVAFGLGLQGMGEVQFDTNLLPQDKQLDNFLAQKRVGVAVALVVLWIALLISYFYMGSKLDKITEEKNKLKGEVSSIKKLDKSYDELVQKIEPVSLKAKNLASYSAGKFAVLDAMNKVYASLDELSEEHPGVLLVSLRVDNTTQQVVDEWIESLPAEYGLNSLLDIVTWKASNSRKDEELTDIFGKFEPSRLPKRSKCVISGEAPVGEGVEKLMVVEKFIEKLKAEGTPLDKVVLSTDWKELDKELPDGSTGKYISFEISCEVNVLPYDSNWGSKKMEEEIPEELR